MVLYFRLGPSWLANAGEMNICAHLVAGPLGEAGGVTTTLVTPTMNIGSTHKRLIKMENDGHQNPCQHDHLSILWETSSFQCQRGCCSTWGSSPSLLQKRLCYLLYAVSKRKVDFFVKHRYFGLSAIEAQKHPSEVAHSHFFPICQTLDDNQPGSVKWLQLSRTTYIYVTGTICLMTKYGSWDYKYVTGQNIPKMLDCVT